jgi:hypothetical protein
VARLSASGVSVLRLKAGLQRLREIHPEITLNSLPARHVVTDGVDIFFRPAELPIERAFDGQLAFTFVIKLERLRDEVKDALQKLRHLENVDTSGSKESEHVG